jgi:bacteriocin-like protein
MITTLSAGVTKVRESSSQQARELTTDELEHVSGGGSSVEKKAADTKSATIGKLRA